VTDSAQRRCHIQTKSDHRLAHATPLGGFVQGLTTASDLERGLLGDQERSREPVGLILLLRVPSATSSVIKGGAGAVKQKSMREFVRKVACATSNAVGIVVCD